MNLESYAILANYGDMWKVAEASSERQLCDFETAEDALSFAEHTVCCKGADEIAIVKVVKITIPKIPTCE